MENIFRRGEIYYADLNPVIGSEQGGIRPVLILQNNKGNRYSPTTIIAALSGKTKQKANIPTHYYVQAFDGLFEDSIVLLEQIRTIDKSRLSDYIATLTNEDMQVIDKCLAISLALDQQYK